MKAPHHVFPMQTALLGEASVHPPVFDPQRDDGQADSNEDYDEDAWLNESELFNFFSLVQYFILN